MSELTCPYYFRITALDKPGVLATIAGIFSKHAISIKSVIQKSRHELDPVSIVLHSHMANEDAVQASIEEINALDVCTEETVTIRILTTDDK
jgi:homoserine dehydrogenase